MISLNRWLLRTGCTQYNFLTLYIFRSDSISRGEDIEGVLAKAAHRSHVVSNEVTDTRLGGGDREHSIRDQFSPSKFSPDLYNHSPELESDVEKEELRPESPGDSSRSSPDFSRSLPSNLTHYTSQFGNEEARLRFSLGSSPYKNHPSLPSSGSLPGFSDDLVSRRYSIADSMQDVRSQPIPSGPSSQPGSPQSDSIRSFLSPGAQSLHDLSYDEDQRNLIPRIKEGLFFCHLCSFSGKPRYD